MTDLLNITSGRIVIRDTDGSISFDTDERPFLPLASINGALTINEATSTANSGAVTSYTDRTNNFYLGACAAQCNVVRGAFYVNTAGASFGDTGVPIGWYNASGTYVHAFENSSMCAYTFIATGGGVFLNERSVVVARRPSSGSVTLTIYAVTLTYKLIAGVFL